MCVCVLKCHSPLLETCDVSQLAGRLATLEVTMAPATAWMQVQAQTQGVYAGRLAVIGVMLQEGTADPNPAVRYALENVPDAAGQEKATGPQSMQLQSLLPQPESNGHRPYIHYVGSLTTPPCSEEVQWFVFTNIVVIPGRQVEQFQQFADRANLGVPANARPLMPLNGRSLDYAYL